MKSIADWTQEIAERNNHEPEPKKVTWQSLEADGLVSWNPKSEDFEAVCKICGEWKPIYCGPEDFVDGEHYCGGSPRCCP